MHAERILKEEQLDELFLLSTFCIEGLMPTQENIDALANDLELDEQLNPIYTCTGSMINSHFELTGDNQYPAGYPFIFVYDYYDVGKRIELGAQWFDVIIEEDLIKEELQYEETSQENEFVDE